MAPTFRIARPALALAAGAVALAGLIAIPAAAAPEIDATAPDFTLPGADGQDYTLSDYRGRTVILEWTNHDCPYVRKHYDGDNMQALQKDATEDGAVWFSIISSAPGRQGHVTAAEAQELTESRDAAPTAVLFDEGGEVGRLYDAKTTPHMYVIDDNGTLRYAGAIDDKPTARPASLEGAENYVRNALADLAAGEPVAVAVTEPYGCTIKYAN